MTNSKCEVVILGAGPYGLAASAHLRMSLGMETRTFGQPMSFWKHNMPEGMLLRSAWSASTISDPKGAYSLDVFKNVSGNHLAAPVPLKRFIDYGLWFQKKIVPDLDERKIKVIEATQDGFRVTLEDGEILNSRRVVIAGGIGPFARQVKQFADVPKSLASHTSEHPDLTEFSGKKVVVVGAGQSALETAALLHEQGVDVELIGRTRAIHYLGWKDRLQQLGPVSWLLFSPTDVGPAAISRLVALPDVLRTLPRGTQDRLRIRSIRPAGAKWLTSRLRDVPTTVGRSIRSAVPTGGRLRITLDDSSERLVDYALLGTGYQIDVARYPYLSPGITKSLRMVNGFPVLGAGFESSIPGLHFLGAPAGWSFGPLMYFVSGTEFVARNLAKYLAGQRKS